jgi:hypothetical protein
MYISYDILLCLPCRGPNLDHTAGRVGFNSDWLTSSTTAKDYFNFARTLGYALPTTTTTRQNISLRRLLLRILRTTPAGAIDKLIA